MKRIVGKEFFIIQGDEKDEDSSSSEVEEDVVEEEGTEEVEVEGEVAVGERDVATPMDVVSQEEKNLTRDRDEEEDREDLLNDRPTKKLKTSHVDSHSTEHTSSTSSSSSFVSKCIIL